MLSAVARILLLVGVVSLLAGCRSRSWGKPVEGPGNTIHSYTEQASFADPEPAGEEELLDENWILARVNGEIITVRSIKAEYREALEARGPMSEQELEGLIVGWTMAEVRNRLLLSAAKRDGVEIPRKKLEEEIEKEEKKAKERGTTLEEDLESRDVPRWEWEEDLEKRLTVEHYLRMLGGAAAPISPGTRALVDPRPRPADIRGRYDRSREAFRVQGAARVDAIFFRWADFEEVGGTREGAIARARDLAREVRERIRRGELFERLREEHQEKPILTEPIVRGSRGDAVERFAFQAEVGEVSEVIPTPQSNFLLLRLVERRPGGISPFADVAPMIGENMRVWSASLASLTIVSRLLRESVIDPPLLRARIEQAVQRDLLRTLMELSL